MSDLVSREAVMAAVGKMKAIGGLAKFAVKSVIEEVPAALPAAGDERPQAAEEIRLEQIESIICQNKRFTVEEQAREIAKLFPPPQEAGDE